MLRSRLVVVCRGATRRELVLIFECGSLSCELFDACLRGDRDRVGGVVVFFEVEALPAYGLIDFGKLPPHGGELGRMVVVDGAE
jgi:hypothetical protein